MVPQFFSVVYSIQPYGVVIFFYFYLQIADMQLCINCSQRGSSLLHFISLELTFRSQELLLQFEALWINICHFKPISSRVRLCNPSFALNWHITHMQRINSSFHHILFNLWPNARRHRNRSSRSSISCGPSSYPSNCRSGRWPSWALDPR